MSDSMKQRYMNAQQANSYVSGIACACATQGNEYGYSYYWWYYGYGIATGGCHALEKRN